MLPLFLLPAFGVGHHLFGSGVPGLKDRQPRPRLICIKQTGSQFLRIRRATVTRKKLLAKNFSLGSQFNGSRDGLRPFALVYIELEVVSGPPLISCGFPEGIPHGFSLIPIRNVTQPDSQCRKRKSYFQYFTFDFFSIAVIKPDPLLKQYHPKSPVTLGTF
ncbi:hypothetical protein Cgig2_030151 [Carnegiea gigantea]|uniref:Uncharacterized protein n=1 Tax=Carnegiea gigantea TaxID=171969 RepID=A0A9Q1K0K4_9CARY|nr:hypothetical protein Cgig2_030151 [Carnegiea gigantea]